MKRFYFLAVFLWSIYFAVFPVFLNAAMSRSEAESNEKYLSYYYDGAEIARTILTQLSEPGSSSVNENVIIDSISRIASEIQNMGGVKSLKSEAFNKVFADEVARLTNELALSMDEETLSAISSGPIYKMLSDLMNNAELQEYVKGISSVDSGGIGIAKDVQQLSFSAILTSITSTLNNILSNLLGGSTSTVVGSVVSDALLGVGLLGVDGLDAITDLLGVIGSIAFMLVSDALLGAGLLGVDGLDAITDLLGDAGSIAGAEVVDLLQTIGTDLFELFNGIPTILGATIFGAGSAFLLGTVSAILGRALTSPITFFIFPTIEFILSFVDGILLAIVCGLAGLVVGVIGYLITHLVDIADIIPGIEYNSTFWTVGGAAIVSAIATITGGVAGAVVGGLSSLPVPIPIIGNPGLSIVNGALMGATSGMIIGFGIGLIALSGA